MCSSIVALSLFQFAHARIDPDAARRDRGGFADVRNLLNIKNRSNPRASIATGLMVSHCIWEEYGAVRAERLPIHGVATGWARADLRTEIAILGGKRS